VFWGRLETMTGQHLQVVPADVLSFGDEAARRLREQLGGRFVGAYFVGSVALGGYVPGHSDIDIVAVAAPPPAAEEKANIVAVLSHPTLRCPTRGLEFVLYERSRAEEATPDAGIEINLNTGPRMATHVGFDASREPRFWFVIDRAIAHVHGLTIDGPTAADLFAPIPRAWLLEALMESMAWHRAQCLPRLAFRGRERHGS
jgi:Nucleotidyltransferase domain